MSGLVKSLTLLVCSDANEVITGCALFPGKTPSQEGPGTALGLAGHGAEREGR